VPAHFYNTASFIFQKYPAFAGIPAELRQTLGLPVPSASAAPAPLAPAIVDPDAAPAPDADPNVADITEDEIVSLLENYVSGKATAFVKAKSTLVANVYGQSRYAQLKGESIPATLTVKNGVLKLYLRIPDATGPNGSTFYQALERGKQFHTNKGHSEEASKYTRQTTYTLSRDSGVISEADYDRIAAYVQAHEASLAISQAARVK
jgi:hypothetical protein